jgi:hypothetical protein
MLSGDESAWTATMTTTETSMLATTTTTTTTTTGREEHPATRQGRQQGEYQRHFYNSVQHHYFTLCLGEKNNLSRPFRQC